MCVLLMVLLFLFMTMVWFPTREDAKTAWKIIILRQVVFYIPMMLLVPKFYGVSSIYRSSALIDWIVFGIILLAVKQTAEELRLMEKS